MNLFQFMQAFEYIRNEFGDQIDVEIHPIGHLEDFDYFEGVAVSQGIYAATPDSIQLVWDSSVVSHGLPHNSPYSMVIRFTDDQMEVAVRPSPVVGDFQPVKESS